MSLSAAVLGALAIDALAIEPFRLEVTHHTLREPIDAPLTIAHVSDLHTHGIGAREEKVLAALDREKPDLIVITGDTVSDGPDPAIVGTVLDRMHAPLGVLLVRGNWEHWHAVPGPRAFYAAHGVKYLNNDSTQVRGDVWVAGFDDAMLGHPDPDAALSGVPAGAFVIGIFHSPSLFDRLDDRVPLAFAGHTHGGQIRIPFLPPFWLPKGSGRFVEGWYTRGRSRMYVSRGIGTSVLPMRFDCEPELALIRLEPEHAASAAE